MTPCDCPLCQYARFRGWRPLPWWRRYTHWDWLFVACCLAGAAVCAYLVVRG
jgi:hypothetical protein